MKHQKPFPLTELFESLSKDFLKTENTETFTYVTPEDLEEKFSLDEKPLNPDELKEHLEELIKYIPSTARRDFFNQLFGSREESAVLGDMLASFINSSMYTFKIAGVLVHVERILIKKISALCGFSDAGGSFFPGGSISNLCALLAARSAYFPEAKQKGIYDFKPIIYASEEGHYSILKNANIVGIGRENVRIISSDERGKMKVDELESEIRKDKKSGKKPFFVCATAGTTVLGTYDLLEEITEIAGRHDLWTHVDGAFGGSAIFSPKHSKLLAGIEAADSVTIDAHKMLGVPLICSVALFKDKNSIGTALSENADYLFQTEHEYNPGEFHIQCGRKNDVLKFWCFWKYHGHSGMADKINKQFQLAQMFADMIRNHPEFELLIEPESLNVCFSHPQVSAEIITEELNKKGLSKIGHGKFKNKNYVRAVLVNPRLSQEDLTAFMKKIEKVISEQAPT